MRDPAEVVLHHFRNGFGLALAACGISLVDVGARQPEDQVNMTGAMRWLLLAVLAPLLGGCATGALWQEGRFARFREPATPPNLQLSYCTRVQDVLVQYDEAREQDTTISRRAYYLHMNLDRVESRRKPRFVPPARAVGLAPVPIRESSLIPTEASALGLYELFATNGYEFTLLSTNTTLGSYELPAYADSSGRVKQVLLTPLAVVADATIIGGIIAYLTLPESWGALNTLQH
jgi:hypothetical protein